MRWPPKLRRLPTDDPSLADEAAPYCKRTLTTRRKELEALMHMLLRDETVERDALLGVLSTPQPADSPATVSHAA